MSKRILVIDDEERIRKLYSEILEREGCHAETAESGESAIELVKKNRYELIFLDLKMKGLDGVETLRELRKLAGDVPIYIVTAFAREYMSFLIEAARDGVEFEIMLKPISTKDIVEVARSVSNNPAF